MLCILIVFKSYLKTRYFNARGGTEILFFLSPIKASVTQAAKSSPISFNLYSADQPKCSNVLVVEFAEDKAIYTTHNNPITASENLHNHLNYMTTWYSKWRVKVDND